MEQKIALGIELGSTRIKAVTIDETHAPVTCMDTAGRRALQDKEGKFHVRKIETARTD